MSFKDTMAQDAKTVFVNCDEFGEVHDIQYDGETYEDVPCTITRPKEVDRNPPVKDHAQGIYAVTNRFHCATDALEVVPEKGSKIRISDGDFWREFYVVKSGSDPGMINLDLKELDE